MEASAVVVTDLASVSAMEVEVPSLELAHVVLSMVSGPMVVLA